MESKKSSIDKLLRWILMIGWMVLIFNMSHQNGVESTQKSDFVARLLTYIGIDGNEYVKGIITFCIRKAAHFTEYFILFVFVYRVLVIYFNKYLYINIGALLVTFIYACSDELHQAFIPGRECALRDVLIDTAGGILAYIVIYIINKVKKKKLIG